MNYNISMSKTKKIFIRFNAGRDLQSRPFNHGFYNPYKKHLIKFILLLLQGE